MSEIRTDEYGEHKYNALVSTFEFDVISMETVTGKEAKSYALFTQIGFEATIMCVSYFFNTLVIQSIQTSRVAKMFQIRLYLLLRHNFQNSKQRHVFTWASPWIPPYARCGKAEDNSPLTESCGGYFLNCHFIVKAVKVTNIVQLNSEDLTSISRFDNNLTNVCSWKLNLSFATVETLFEVLGSLSQHWKGYISWDRLSFIWSM